MIAEKERYAAGSVFVDGFIYIIGGILDGKVTANCEKYST